MFIITAKETKKHCPPTCKKWAANERISFVSGSSETRFFFPSFSQLKRNRMNDVSACPSRFLVVIAACSFT